MAGPPTGSRGRSAATRRVALPRSVRRRLGAPRARAARRRRAPARVGRRRRAPAGRVPRAPRLPGARRRPGAVTLERRVGDPARRTPARAHGRAGAAAARRDRGERREPDAGADVGVAGDDARGPGDVTSGPVGTPGSTPGTPRRTSCGRRGATSSGCRISTADRSTSSVRPTASPATCSSSPAGGALDHGPPSELERRAVRVLARHAIRADGLAQWPPSLEPSSQEARTQWCHGAPGIVASCATLAPGDAELDELLLAGGELTWRGRAAPEGREPLPRHRGKRLRLPQALRAHRRRALAGARACVRDARRRAGRAGRGRARTGPSHALDRRPRDSPLPRELPLRDGRVPDDRPLLSSGLA